jgi:iron complex outermembrane receptor protein
MGNSVLKVLSFAACVIFLSTFYPSTASPQDSEVMEEITIEAERDEDTRAEVKDESAFVTVIEAEDFSESLNTVPEVLEQSVGVTVRRFGGLGSFSTASIRGSSAEQVAIFLDGVPLNRGKSGVVNLENIPLRSVERIEVYRGTVPLRFRTSGIGGALNIVTKKITDKLYNQISGSYGSFDTYEVNATSSGTLKKFGYMVSGNFQGSDGDFEFLDDNGTPLVPEDDETTERENNDFDARNLLVKLTYTPTKNLRFEVMDSYFDKNEGVPGLGNAQSDSASLETLRNVFNFRAKKNDLFFQGLDAESTFYLLWEETRFQDLDGDIGTGRQDNTSENLAWGVDGYFSYYLGIHQILSLLASYQRERFDSEDPVFSPSEPKSPTQKRNIYQFGFEDEIYVWNDRLVFTPQVLYTYVNNDFVGEASFLPGSFDPPDDTDFFSVKGGVRVGLTENFSLQGNAGRFFRYPNFSELFGDRGGFIGNPELEPEEGFNWDAGISFDKRGFRIGILPVNMLFMEAAYFFSKTDNLILFEQNSQRTARATNISSAEIRGVETSWAVTVLDHLAVSGNYTFQKAENTSVIPFLNKNRLPGRPESQLFTKVEIYNRRAKLFYEYDFISENFLDQANLDIIVERRSIHNLGISIFPLRFLTMTFEVKNLGDSQIVDFLAFPLPGRSYAGTLLVEF